MTNDLGAQNQGEQSVGSVDTASFSAANSQIFPQAGAKADDIFAETEPKDKPPVFQPKTAGFDSIPVSDDNSESHQKIFVLIFFILAVLLIGAVGIWAYRFFAQKVNTEDSQIKQEVLKKDIDAVSEALISGENDPVQVEPIQEGGALPEQVADQNTSAENGVLPEQVVDQNQLAEQPKSEDSAVQEGDKFLDSDGDGLLDEEEWQLGTAVDNVDTDNDGLFDRDEIKVYMTNARLADTDGDGYADGEEVKKGYNPLGEGRLYGVN